MTLPPAARASDLTLQVWRRAACVRLALDESWPLAELARWQRPLNARLSVVPVDGRGVPAAQQPGAPPLPSLLADAWTSGPPRLVRRRTGSLTRLGSRRHPAAAALLAGPSALGLHGHVLVPLRTHRMLVAPLGDEAALDALCDAAEGAREADDRLLMEPLVASDGPFPWTRWQPPAGTPLAHRVARLRALQDLDDYRLQHDAFVNSDERAGHIRHWSTLKLHRRAGVAGGVVSTAIWMPFETVLPAADLVRVVLPGDELWEVWVDEILDIFTAETRPLAHAWPPRFVTRGGFPQAHHARLRGAGALVGHTRAAVVEVETD